MDLVYKIAGIGIIIAIISELLERSGKKDLSTFVTISGTIAILFIISREISDLFILLKSLFSF